MASEPIKEHITVALIGSGFAALHMRYYDDIQDFDVEQTGIGRYRTYKEAVIEARIWSESNEIELKLPAEFMPGNPWD